MIAVCGTTYKLITSVTFPENPHANESPFFVPLLKFTNENYDRINLEAEDAAFKRDFPVPLQKELNVRRKQEAFLRYVIMI